jgi:hypothetical protein
MIAISSRALCCLSRLAHPSLRHSRAGAIGLQNPASSDPPQEKSDKYFGDPYCMTIGFFSNIDADEFFPMTNSYQR